jgi:hypothetical protein
VSGVKSVDVEVLDPSLSIDVMLGCSLAKRHGQNAISILPRPVTMTLEESLAIFRRERRKPA